MSYERELQNKGNLKRWRGQYPRTGWFQLLTLQSKTTAYNFYCTMAHLTDNTGLHTLRVSLVNYTSYSKDWWLTCTGQVLSFHLNGQTMAASQVTQMGWLRPWPLGCSQYSLWCPCTFMPCLPTSWEELASQLGGHWTSQEVRDMLTIVFWLCDELMTMRTDTNMPRH